MWTTTYSPLIRGQSISRVYISHKNRFDIGIGYSKEHRTSPAVIFGNSCYNLRLIEQSIKDPDPASFTF